MGDLVARRPQSDPHRTAGARRVRGRHRHVHRPRHIQRPTDPHALRWNDIHSPRPWWEQAFSPDDGARWEVNWRNYFTRTAPTPTPCRSWPTRRRTGIFWSAMERAASRLRQRLVGSNEWDEFGGTLVNWPVLGGHGNVGDNFMEFPGETVRGVGLRAFDPATRQWLSWWLDGRNPSVIAPPLRGGFANGIGTFVGDDTLDGRPIKTRVTGRESRRARRAGNRRARQMAA